MIFNGVTELGLPECGAIDLFSCHVELVGEQLCLMPSNLLNLKWSRASVDSLCIYLVDHNNCLFRRQLIAVQS